MFHQVADEVCQRARAAGECLEFEFNEIAIEVHPGSLPVDICIQYDLKHRISRLKAGYKE